VVDEDRASGQAMDDPAIAKHHLLDVRSIGDTDEHDVARLAQFDRIGGEVTDEIHSLPRGPVPHRQAVPGHEQVQGHAVAHGAEADETETSHGQAL
jgi:hypothetical protein